MYYLVFKIPTDARPQVEDTQYGPHMPPMAYGATPQCVAITEADDPDEACTIAASLTGQLGVYAACEANLTHLGVNRPQMKRGVLSAAKDTTVAEDEPDA